MSRWHFRGRNRSYFCLSKTDWLLWYCRVILVACIVGCSLGLTPGSCRRSRICCLGLLSGIECLLVINGVCIAVRGWTWHVGTIFTSFLCGCNKTTATFLRRHRLSVSMGWNFRGYSCHFRIACSFFRWGIFLFQFLLSRHTSWNLLDQIAGQLGFWGRLCSWLFCCCFFSFVIEQKSLPWCLFPLRLCQCYIVDQ